ncbi:MAG: hypothetical protein ACMZ7B_07070 [Balneola sp.]
MKRLIIITFITVFTATTAMAQRSRVHQINYSYENYNNELREIQKFDHQSDKFSFALMTGDSWAARKNKAKIIRFMEAEIWDTRRELDELSNYSNHYSKRDGYETYRGRNGGVYSKNKGRKATRYEERLLLDRLEKQIRIKNRFEDTELMGFRRDELINKRVHRQLMYRFRDTMTEGLEKERRDSRG